MSFPAPGIKLPPPSEASSLPDIVNHIGDTPLIQLKRVTQDVPDAVTIYGKAEHLNPGGSVKDRPALRMIQEGLRSGALTGGKTLIDATSGNTGIAYAMLGAAYNIPVELALPSNASEERKEILRTFGAELTLTDPMESTDGAQRVVKELVEAEPEHYFYPDQYNNEANWQSHYEGTALEILDQTDGGINHFVTGLGTTGTFVGIARRLREASRDVRCWAMQPASAMHGLEGLKHLDTAIVPGIYESSLADEHLCISTEEAFSMTRQLARAEGLLVGPSSGANVAAALKVAAQIEEGVIVTILCDTGTRYLSEPFWNE